MSSKVLVLPADAIISLKNAGGNNEPRADWSKQVRDSINESTMGYMFEHGIQYVPYESDQIQDEHIDVVRQAAVMLDAVEFSQKGGGIESERVYALGKGSIQALANFDADYVLIVVLRSEVASGGRYAVAFLGALAGAAVTTSSAQFRAGLFDLRDGQIKWANFDPLALQDIGNVAKADEEHWIRAINHILSEFPL